MRQVKVAELKVGDVVALDVVNRRSQTLLKEGTTVEARHLTALTSSGVTNVYVHDAPSSEPGLSPYDSALLATSPGVQRDLPGDHPAVVEMARLVDEYQPPSRRLVAALPTNREASDELEDPKSVSGKWQRLTAEKIVSKLSALASLPAIYLRVNTVINKPSSSTADIAEVLGYDPALSARILRIAIVPSTGSRAVLKRSATPFESWGRDSYTTWSLPPSC